MLGRDSDGGVEFRSGQSDCTGEVLVHARSGQRSCASWTGESTAVVCCGTAYFEKVGSSSYVKEPMPGVGVAVQVCWGR